MAKKSKDDVPNASSVTNKDMLQRLNFLYQASVYLNGLSSSCDPSPAPSNSAKGTGKRSRRNRTRCASALELSQSYTKDMKTIGKKAMVRMDPTMKRTICKTCSAPLISGASARVRIKASSSHKHAVTYTCISCSSLRRIPAPALLDDPVVTAPQGMDVDPLVGSTSSGRKKGPAPRLPPLFEREVHVILRGNQKLRGDGS